MTAIPSNQTSNQTTDQTLAAPTGARERTDLLETLGKHRTFLRFTLRDLTDEQAAQRPTASALSLGGLVKHVSDVEAGWARFIVQGPDAMGYGEVQEWGPEQVAAREREFTMQPGETVASLLAAYAEVARTTDDLVAALPDLDDDQALPEAPWFEPGARWSARRVLLHIIAETAQHAGHADIIRESLDGAKTMG